MPDISHQHPATKIDGTKALKWRLQGLSYQDIANRFGCTKQSVHDKLKRFKDLIEAPDDIDAFRNHEVELLDSALMTLVGDITDKQKRKKATLGNVAYAIDKLHNYKRLVQGKSTSNVMFADVSSGMQEAALKYAESMAKQLMDKGE